VLAALLGGSAWLCRRHAPQRSPVQVRCWLLETQHSALLLQDISKEASVPKGGSGQGKDAATQKGPRLVPLPLSNVYDFKEVEGLAYRCAGCNNHATDGA
jgi:hypothetical protein